MRQVEIFLAGGSDPGLFLIGKNSRGQWVAQDQRGLRGGLFVSRAEALKYALFENGKRPHLVVTMPGPFELDMSANAFPACQAKAPAEASFARAA
jgi:hypothetical protein